MDIIDKMINELESLIVTRLQKKLPEKSYSKMEIIQIVQGDVKDEILKVLKSM